MDIDLLKRVILKNAAERSWEDSDEAVLAVIYELDGVVTIDGAVTIDAEDVYNAIKKAYLGDQ